MFPHPPPYPRVYSSLLIFKGGGESFDTFLTAFQAKAAFSLSYVERTAMFSGRVLEIYKRWMATLVLCRTSKASTTMKLTGSVVLDWFRQRGIEEKRK